jgi:hypothetical protein
MITQMEKDDHTLVNIIINRFCPLQIKLQSMAEDSRKESHQNTLKHFPFTTKVIVSPSLRQYMILK